MSAERATILVVDDEPSVTDLLSEDLVEEGYNCVTAATGEDALERLSSDDFDALLLDLRLPGISGVDVLREVKSRWPQTAVLVVTAVGDAQTAVEVMKIGAIDYITKPFELDQINSSVEAALETRAAMGSVSTVIPEVSSSGEETDWAYYLDAIANGVEARLDSLNGYIMTMTVIDRTIAVARDLSIPERHINEWADTRRKRAERFNILHSITGNRLPDLMN